MYFALTGNVVLVENSFSGGRESPLSPNEDHVIVGRIRSPWGVQGDVKVDVLTDVPRRFSPGSVLYLKGQATRVQRSRTGKGGLIVKLDVIDDRNVAETFRGQLLTVPRDDIEPLPEGSYYHFQILGMNVQTDEGENLGNIKEIIVTGTNDVYVVTLAGRRDILVPSLEDVILDVDLDKNLMTVRLPEGLR